MTELKVFYRRSLPHYQPPGATIFLTWRLANSLPVAVLEAISAERRRMLAVTDRLPDPALRADSAYKADRLIFGKFDRALCEMSNGPYWLREPAVAGAVVQHLHHTFGLYTLEAFTLMPNHAHVVLTPNCGPDGEFHCLGRITQLIKGRTSYFANKILGRTGPFWQQESYDHVVRSPEEMERIVKYILWNPVKAGLVGDWRAWPWSYARLVPDGM